MTLSGKTWAAGEALGASHRADHNALPDAVKNNRGIDVTSSDYGAVGDGVTDDSAAVTAAVNAAATAGTNVVFPAGSTFVMEGVPLKEGVSYLCHGANFELPAGATGAMFVAAAGSEFFGGGIQGGEFNGGDQAQGCVDFSALTRLDYFRIDGAYIHDFAGTAVELPDNTRRCFIADTRFFDNGVGLLFGEHANVDHCEFRNNTTGITGRLNDFVVVGSKFLYNTDGVKPTSGDDITNGSFVGCDFYGNTGTAAQVTRAVTFSSCLISGAASASAVGVDVLGVGVTFTGCRFGEADTASHFTTGAIRWSGGDAVLAQMVVSACFFRSNNAVPLIALADSRLNGLVFEGCTLELTDGALAEDTGRLQRCRISGNHVVLDGTGANFLNMGEMLNSQVHDNIIEVNGVTLTDAIITVGDTFTIGNTFEGNTLLSVNSGAAVFLAGDVRGTILLGNRLRVITWDAAEITNDDANTLIVNNLGIADGGGL